MVVRKSIHDMLVKHGSFDVIGEAADGIEALTLSKSLNPDLLILDIAMPKSTGIEVIEEMRRWCPDTKIAVLTGVSSPNLLQHVVDSKVDGIFLKSGDASHWAGEFHAICAGEDHEHADLSDVLPRRTDARSLTRRERQTLFGIARGEQNGTIAERLGISANTVDKYRTSIMRKLRAHTSAELVTRAFKDGLLDASEID